MTHRYDSGSKKESVAHLSCVWPIWATQHWMSYYSIQVFWYSRTLKIKNEYSLRFMNLTGNFFWYGRTLKLKNGYSLRSVNCNLIRLMPSDTASRRCQRLFWFLLLQCVDIKSLNSWKIIFVSTPLAVGNSIEKLIFLANLNVHRELDRLPWQGFWRVRVAGL
jgi:hypothetical protein